MNFKIIKFISVRKTWLTTKLQRTESFKKLQTFKHDSAI